MVITGRLVDHLLVKLFAEREAATELRLLKERFGSRPLG